MWKKRIKWVYDILIEFVAKNRYFQNVRPSKIRLLQCYVELIILRRSVFVTFFHGAFRPSQIAVCSGQLAGYQLNNYLINQVIQFLGQPKIFRWSAKTGLEFSSGHNLPLDLALRMASISGQCLWPRQPRQWRCARLWCNTHTAE